MVDAIFGDIIAKEIFKGFKGLLLKGTLRRPTATTKNALGDPVAGVPIDYPFEGFREDYSAAFAAAAGIPTTDCRVLIIALSLANGTVLPAKDDLVLLQTKWYQVRRLEAVDPATATYMLQCFEIKTPA